VKQGGCEEGPKEPQRGNTEDLRRTPVITVNTPGKVEALPMATATNLGAMYLQPKVAVRWLSDEDNMAILNVLAAAVTPQEL
jgi:hypothetical protein